MEGRGREDNSDHEVEHIIALLSCRTHGRHHALGKAFALASEVAVAPEHSVSELNFAVVVRGVSRLSDSGPVGCSRHWRRRLYEGVRRLRPHR